MTVKAALHHLLISLLFLAAGAILVPLPVCAQEQTVCIQCHELLPGPGSLPVRSWQGSIHAENGISCHHCHGGDPRDSPNSMNADRGFLGTPGEAEIPSFCGRCHVGIEEEYLRSAHGRAGGKRRPTCVTCHGSHGTAEASLELINERSCARCHGYEKAAEIKGAMQENEGAVELTGRRISRFKGMGVDTEALEKRLFATRNSYRRLFHDLDVARVVAESGRIRGELERLDASLDVIDQSLQKRKLAGFAAVGLPLLAALLCYLLRKTFE